MARACRSRGAAQAAQPSPQAGIPAARIGERMSQQTASHPRVTAPRRARLHARRADRPRHPAPGIRQDPDRISAHCAQGN